MQIKPRGATGEEKAATSEIQTILNDVKHLIESRLNTTFNELTALKFRTQSVAGTNYFVKARTPNNEHIHVRIFRALDNNYRVDGIQTGRSDADPVDYFDMN